MMKSRLHRGSALIAALIIIGVLALVTVATLQLANISKQSATKDARRLSQTSCVEAARQYLLSRLRLIGPNPTTLVLNQTVALEAGNRTLYTGHVRTTDANGRPNTTVLPVISSVVALPVTLVSNSSAKARDIANGIGRATTGGASYRVVVACSDPLAGDVEMEFTFKYGL
jgi:Tfp pilus assembly protein PilX